MPPVPPVPPLPPGCDLSRNMSHTTCGHTNALRATRGHKHTHTMMATVSILYFLTRLEQLVQTNSLSIGGMYRVY